MRRSFRFLPLLAVALLASVVCAIEPTSSPVSPKGTRAMIDLPASQHMRNTGGNDRTRMNPLGLPGKGSGLCVWTSFEHLARWQNVYIMYGLQKWMTNKPGGGYPEKVDALIPLFCKEKGVPVPLYIQHTGGDVEFLELALKTDRLVAVTYNGRDDFYPGEIYHMVNLAHLDANWAAIIDNNRPGNWIWMTRSEFISRWKGSGGGWAIVLLNPPPPPYMTQPVETVYDGPVYDQCKDGRCPLPPSTQSDGWQELVIDGDKSWKFFRAGKFVGLYDSRGWHPASESGIGWSVDTRDLPDGLELPVTANAIHEEYPTGVTPGKVPQEKRYTHTGRSITRHEAFASLQTPNLFDDSTDWHLTAVGDAAFLEKVKVDLTLLPEEVRAKVLFQAYAPSDWPVNQFTLPTGLNLRKPSPGRVGADVATVSAADYTPDKLTWLLQQPGGPLPPVIPIPMPGPDVPTQFPSWVWPVGILGIILLLRRK